MSALPLFPSGHKITDSPTEFIRGIREIRALVGATMGPFGTNVIPTGQQMHSAIWKDGARVIEGYTPNHPIGANAVQRITGMLIFDGIRFCQYVEGSKNDVLALFERICADSRHAAVTLIHQGPVQERRFKKFSLAFANGDDFEALSRLESLKGHSGLSAFSEMIPTLDMEV